MNGPRHKIRAKTRKNRDIRFQWSWRSPTESSERTSLLPATCHVISMSAHLLFFKANHYSLCASGFHSWSKSRLPETSVNVRDNKEVYQISNQLSYWPAACGGGWTVALFRGVRAGWIGRIPGLGWVCPALGLWRGAIEVSVVGMGSVSLEKEGGKTQIHINVWESGRG